MPAKVGLNLVDLLEFVSFMHARVCIPTQLELCLYDQLWIASLLLVSLLFITIPTPFLIFNFYLFLLPTMIHTSYLV